MNGEYTIKIIPGKFQKSGPMLTSGTVLMVGENEIAGVTGLTLRADVDDLWRATIEAYVRPPDELLAAARFNIKPDRWWQKAWRRITGKARDVTSLDSTSRRWAP